ncbi:nitroreductase [Enterovirga rhinocerotis]|uniref:Nitroreductase n=1 Tax=Enterovirga rhinocerotis TaxID=1339210 RepID=A0A4R7BU48_9HYPH|nr:nitroreductase [Enterovirga rhinocerotis]TDR89284.1 nitroreductase [Enterovirga rhinocerotis]
MDASLSPPAAAADLLEALLRQRHSCRAFRPDPVPRPLIERMLGIAQRAASWCNSQPWQVVVTSGAETERFREAFAAAFAAGEDDAPDIPWPSAYEGVYLARRRECGYQLYDSVGVPRGDREAGARQAAENFRFFGAPHVAIVTSDAALGPYGAVDCGSYVGHVLLAAQSLGIATIAQAALASRSGLIRRHFGLPDDRRVVCGIAFGYEDEAHPANGFRTSRASLEEAVTFLGS